MDMFGNCAASCGMIPVGHMMPLILTGLKLVGVTPLTSLKSNVSVWLGAPAIRMKITFFALFCRVTGFESTTMPAAAGLADHASRGHSGAEDLEKLAAREVPARVKWAPWMRVLGDESLKFFLW